MKNAFVLILTFITLNVFSQAKRSGVKTTGRTSAQKTTTPVNVNASNTQAPVQPQQLQPRQTITEKYLNGPTRNSRNSSSAEANSTGTTSPFVGGVHGADNASKTFDTIGTPRGSNDQNGAATVRAVRDTTFNVNTTISQGGVTTNSGAVDRSGQAQFGQTNWGNSRSTVGESQWTIPPPITASFKNEFPAPVAATWTRNNVDTTIFSARYKSGAHWVTSTYNSAGQRLDMQTEFPLIQPPRPVSVYMAKQPVGFRAATIYKLQVQGRPDVYKIETASGKKIYINNDGMEVTY